MKFSRKTKIRIRKAFAFARTLFLVLCLICIALVVCSVDGESLVFPIVCFIIGAACFGISYAIDQILWETAWSGDPESPFNH